MRIRGWMRRRALRATCLGSSCGRTWCRFAAACQIEELNQAVSATPFGVSAVPPTQPFALQRTGGSYSLRKAVRARREKQPPHAPHPHAVKP